MPDILTIFKKNIEFLTPQEQLDEINHLIYALNNTHFNFTFYAVNRKNEILYQLNKLKKDLLNKYSHCQCKKIK